MLTQVKLRKRVFGALLLALVVFGTGDPAGAQGQTGDQPLAGLTAEAAGRIIDVPRMSALLAEEPSGRLPVVVELALPAGAPAMPTDGPARDHALTQAIGLAQQRVLDRVLGAADQTASQRTESAPAINLRRMSYTPVIALSVDARLLRRLAQDPGVLRIMPDILVPPSLNASRGRIGVPAALQAGATGDGWHVAILDTGARRSHEFLAQRIVSAACYSSNDAASGFSSLCPGGAAQATGINTANDCNPARLRGCGHGTHVAGIAGGYFNDNRTSEPAHGVARNAGLISINVFTRLSASACSRVGYPLEAGQDGCVLAMGSDILRGLERVYDLRHDRRIAAVNLSLAGGRYTSRADCTAAFPPIAQMIDRLRGAGIVTVVAAGNSGYDSAIGWPACLSSAVAVANSALDDTRFSGSNWGPLVDLVAPGRRIRSAVVSGGSDNTYGWMTGTSMAAPHVAGAIAALRSVHPTKSVDQVLDALRQTGTEIRAAGVGRPRINLDRALDRLWGGPAPTEIALRGPDTAVEGEPMRLSVHVTSPRGTPDGTVTLLRGTSAISSTSLGSDGSASFTINDLSPGEHRLTARYVGTNRFAEAVSDPHAVSLEERARGPAVFIGGGSVFGLTDACTDAWGQSSEAVVVSYSPSELNGLPSETSIIWRSGSEHLALWGTMAPSSNFFGAAGRQSWTHFVFYPNRPLLRVVQRQITQPAGITDLERATELVLRLRVQNFSAIAGCSATLVATLRRG